MTSSTVELTNMELDVIRIALKKRIAALNTRNPSRAYLVTAHEKICALYSERMALEWKRFDLTGKDLSP